MEITLTVTVQVDTCEEGSFPSDENAVRNSVQEGVWEALNHANNRGFNHPMADEICMSVVSVEATEPT